jgi:hypothetical protein
MVLNKMVCKWFTVCPMKKYYEQGRLEKKWIQNYCKGNYAKCIRFQMEENGELHPDNMLPNGEIREYLK